MVRELDKLKLCLFAVIGAAFLLALGVGMGAVSRAQPAASVWPMYAHNAMHTCLSTIDTSANPGRQKWRFRVRGPTGDALALAAIGSDGTIYTTSGNFDGSGMLNLFAEGAKPPHQRRR
jgi:hypothetical protein